MTCSSCHDAHGSDQHAHELRSAANDNAACTGCHSAQRYRQVRDHLKSATNEAHDNVDDSLLTCTSCHMVKTIAAGARHAELLDFLPRSAPQLQYEHGDLASHRFAPRLGAAHLQIAALFVLRSPAVHFDFDVLGQFAAQIIDVYACAPIHQRGILACKQAGSHSLPPFARSGMSVLAEPACCKRVRSRGHGKRAEPAAPPCP